MTTCEASTGLQALSNLEQVIIMLLFFALFVKSIIFFLTLNNKRYATI